MFKINLNLPIEITHNVSITNLFTSQNLNTQVEHKIQHLPKHISLASFISLRGELPIKDFKLQLGRITQPITYNSDQ